MVPGRETAPGRALEGKGLSLLQEAALGGIEDEGRGVRPGEEMLEGGPDAGGGGDGPWKARNERWFSSTVGEVTLPVRQPLCPLRLKGYVLSSRGGMPTRISSAGRSEPCPRILEGKSVLCSPPSPKASFGKEKKHPGFVCVAKPRVRQTCNDHP